MDDPVSSKRQRTGSTELPAKCPRVASPEPCVAEFFYFGLQFCYLEVKDEREREAVIKLSTFDAEGSEDMQRAIREDMKKLNTGEVGAKTGYKANGYFLMVEGLKNRCAYVYSHTQHAACSQTKFSQLSYWLKKQNYTCLSDLAIPA